MDSADTYLKRSAENVVMLNISNTELRILVFNDGYEGYKYTFGVDGDKLKMLLDRKVQIDDSVYQEEN